MIQVLHYRIHRSPSLADRNGLFWFGRLSLFVLLVFVSRIFLEAAPFPD